MHQKGEHKKSRLKNHFEVPQLLVASLYETREEPFVTKE